MGDVFNAEVKQILDALGIKSVNYGAATVGEIGGEKETGGGRESGSDAWRA